MATRPTIDELVNLLEGVSAVGGRGDPRWAEVWPYAEVLIAHHAGRKSLSADELELHRLAVETFLASHVDRIYGQLREMVEDRMESARRRQRAERFRKAFGGGEDGG
jgi:hypothetical protein